MITSSNVTSSNVTCSNECDRMVSKQWLSYSVSSLDVRANEKNECIKSACSLWDWAEWFSPLILVLVNSREKRYIYIQCTNADTFN